MKETAIAFRQAFVLRQNRLAQFQGPAVRMAVLMVMRVPGCM